MTIDLRDFRRGVLGFVGRKHAKDGHPMRDWDANSRRLLIAAILLAWLAAYKFYGLL